MTMTDKEFQVMLLGVQQPSEFARELKNNARRLAYQNGRYRIEVPDVTTGNWSEREWMKWIDACDGWDDESLRDPL